MPKPSRLSLKDADKVRQNITMNQSNLIRKMYLDLSREVAQKAKQYEGRDNISSIMRMRYLNELEKQLREQAAKMSFEMQKQIENDMKVISQAVVNDNIKWMNSVGLDIKGAFLYVPKDVVNSIATGQVYDSGWSLSKRIWGANDKVLKDIHTVVSKGIAANMSTYDIAKDIEKYVNPNAKKDWQWSKVYPGTNKKVDYNAQRLARTLSNHAFQQSFVKTTIKNPFVENYKWNTAFSHRTCDTCIEWAQNDSYGLGAGIFPKGALPLDHPNGMCYPTAIITKSDEQIADEIIEWYNSPQGTNQGLDEYVKSMGYNNINVVKTQTTDKVCRSIKDLSDKYGVKFTLDEKLKPSDIDSRVYGMIDKTIQNIHKQLPVEFHIQNVAKEGINFEWLPASSSQAGSASGFSMRLSNNYFSKQRIDSVIEDLEMIYSSNSAIYSAKNMNPVSTFTHEYGHLVHDQIYRLSKATKSNGLNSMSMKYPSKQSIARQNNEIRKNVLSNFDLTGKDYGEISKMLSRYGATDSSEFFAEAFMECMDNPKPRELAVKFKEELDKQMDEAIKKYNKKFKK